MASTLNDAREINTSATAHQSEASEGNASRPLLYSQRGSGLNFRRHDSGLHPSVAYEADPVKREQRKTGSPDCSGLSHISQEETK